MSSQNEEEEEEDSMETPSSLAFHPVMNHFFDHYGSPPQELVQKMKKAAGFAHLEAEQVKKIHLYTDIRFIPASMSLFENLVELTFKNANITAIQHLENLKHLRYLNLSWNYITRIEDQLRNNTDLETLILDANPISYLKETAFARLTKLKELSLIFTHVSSLWNIIIALRSLTSLKHLCLDKSNGTSSTIRSNQKSAAAVSIDTTSIEMDNGSLTDSTVTDDDSIDDEDDEEDNFQPSSVTPVSMLRNYRSYFIKNIPSLTHLDMMLITETERKLTTRFYEESFEDAPYGYKTLNSIPSLLKKREIAETLTRKSSTQRGVGREFKNRIIAAKKEMYSVVTKKKTPFKSRIIVASDFTERHRNRTNDQFSHRSVSSPRQFEYHPRIPNFILCGSTDGYISFITPSTSRVLTSFPTGDKTSVLGLSWFAKDNNRFAAANESGQIAVFSVEDAMNYQPGDSSSSANKSRPLPIVKYNNLDRVTSVSVNCDDALLLASGYSKDVKMYRLDTGKIECVFKNAHDDNINVLKFSHHSPHLFATSSSDRYIKLWDMRMNEPVFTRRSSNGNVMVCFSPDDRFLLASAIDNEVRQYTVEGSGRLHMLFSLPKTKSNHNYTRSYYMNNGEYVIVGSCKQSVVWVCNAKTGRFFRDFELATQNLHPSSSFEYQRSHHLYPHSIYCQSLRADPFSPFRLSVLVCCNSPFLHTEIREIDLL